MVAHEKRNPAQLFCAVPTQNDLALSSLLFSAQPTQKLGYPNCDVTPNRAAHIHHLPRFFTSSSMRRFQSALRGLAARMLHTASLMTS